MNKPKKKSAEAQLSYQAMLDFNREHPELKEVYKLMQKWHLEHGINDGVFCPLPVITKAPQNALPLHLALSSVELESSDDDDVDDLLLEQSVRTMDRINCQQVFGAWRNTLGIYEVDEEIYKQIIKSPIPLETPLSIFERLPEWCVYIKIPEGSDFHVGFFEGESVVIDGFWALFDYKEYFKNANSSRARRLVIRLNPRKTNYSKPNPPPIVVDIDTEITVRDAMKVYELEEPDDFPTDACKPLGEMTQGMVKQIGFSSNLPLFLSLLLWLCAEEPDISNIHGEPMPISEIKQPKFSRNKKTGAFVPPNAPSIYHIGKRLGGEVRQFNEQHGHTDSRISSRKRPHIRKGHWHGVWKGTGQDKQFSVYWQPAIFVNAN